MRNRDRTAEITAPFRLLDEHLDNGRAHEKLSLAIERALRSTSFSFREATSACVAEIRALPQKCRDPYAKERP